MCTPVSHEEPLCELAFLLCGYEDATMLMQTLPKLRSMADLFYSDPFLYEIRCTVVVIRAATNSTIQCYSIAEL